jgi:hypothetical protein
MWNKYLSVQINLKLQELWQTIGFLSAIDFEHFKSAKSVFNFANIIVPLSTCCYFLSGKKEA